MKSYDALHLDGLSLLNMREDTSKTRRKLFKLLDVLH